MVGDIEKGESRWTMMEFSCPIRLFEQSGAARGGVLFATRRFWCRGGVCVCIISVPTQEVVQEVLINQCYCYPP